MHRQVEARLTGIALTTTTASQLVIDTTGLVALGTQDVQATKLADFLSLSLNCGLGLGKRFRPRAAVFFCVRLRVKTLSCQVSLGEELRVTTQHDVSTTTSHICRNGHSALSACHRNNLSFASVLLRIQDLVRNLAFLEHLRQELGLLNRCGTHQDRLAGRVPFFNVIDDCTELTGLGRVDQVGLVLSNHRTVRRNGDDTDLVGRCEFRSLGFGGTGHARTRAFGVEAEVVLKGNGRQGLIFSLDLHPFLCLDGLVHSVVVATPRKNAPGVLVNNEDFSPVDDVIAIAVEEFFGADCIVQETNERGVCSLVKVFNAKLIFNLIDAGFQNADSLLLFVDLVVLVAYQDIGDARELGVPAVHVTRGRAGNDQGGTRFVDQNRVDLIDDDEVVPALDHVFGALCHVVAQVVETEFIIRSVGDICVVLLTAFGRFLPNQHTAHGHSQEVVDARHEI